MGKGFSSVKLALGWLVISLAKLSDVVLLVMTVIVFYDVVMRYIFNSPTSWALEISEYALVFLAFMGAAAVEYKKGGIMMDFVYIKLPLKLRQYCDVIGSFFMVAFSFLILRASTMMTVTAYQYDSTSNTLLGTPMYIPYSIVVIGALFLFLQCVADLVDGARLIISSETDNNLHGRKELV